jgi:hypothetical protein
MLKKIISLLILALPIQASELNNIIQDKWKSEKITPSVEISRAEWTRRLYLDLFGRLPTVDELIVKSSRTKEELVDELLSKKEYGENFSDVWKVILVNRRPDRFNNTVINNDGFDEWLKNKFNNNIYWDKLVYELVSAQGDNLTNPATNFLLSKIEFRGAGKNDVVRATADTTKIFLGLQIQCSQCHDGKTNDWSQEQFWNTAAFFQGSTSKQIDDKSGRDPNAQNLFEIKEVRIKDKVTYQIGSTKNKNTVGAKYLNGEELADVENKDRREALAKFITGPYREQLARAFVNRYWKYFIGKGFVNPVDDLDPSNPAEFPEALDYLSKEFIKKDFNVKWLVKQICLSAPYQLSSIENGDDSYFSHYYVKPMTPEQIYRTFTMLSDRELSKTAQRNFVRIFSGDDDSTEDYELTIQQVLSTMNGQLTKSIINKNKNNEGIFLTLLSRKPKQDELVILKDQKAEDIVWALLNSNEFILNH